MFQAESEADSGAQNNTNSEIGRGLPVINTQAVIVSYTVPLHNDTTEMTEPAEQLPAGSSKYKLLLVNYLIYEK